MHRHASCRLKHFEDDEADRQLTRFLQLIPFELYSQNGRRADLDVFSSGSMALTFFDKDNVGHAAFLVPADGKPRIELMGSNNNSGAELIVTADGLRRLIELAATEQLPGLVPWGANNPRAMLSLLEQGSDLVLDTNFKQRATLGLTENAASLGLRDANEKL